MKQFKVLYQFLKTGTSDRNLKGLEQRLKRLGFSLYPLSVPLSSKPNRLMLVW